MLAEDDITERRLLCSLLVRFLVLPPFLPASCSPCRFHTKNPAWAFFTSLLHPTFLSCVRNNSIPSDQVDQLFVQSQPELSLIFNIILPASSANPFLSSGALCAQRRQHTLLTSSQSNLKEQYGTTTISDSTARRAIAKISSHATVVSTFPSLLDVHNLTKLVPGSVVTLSIYFASCDMASPTLPSTTIPSGQHSAIGRLSLLLSQHTA